MIKYLIVEDEYLAYKELERMMNLLRPQYTLIGHTKTLVETISFLTQNQNNIDLVLLDISLADGDSFEIFNRVEIFCPIIFTTAYDEYAIKAFKLNSIDYLLKPIEDTDLLTALTKFEKLYQLEHSVIDYKKNEAMIANSIKERFLIQKGDEFFYCEITDIAFFYSEDKVCFLHTFDNKRYIIDFTLEQLEQQLSKSLFFRVSRNCIANIKSIVSISKYFNSRLKITFKPKCPHEIIVSRIRVSDFLKWIDGII